VLREHSRDKRSPDILILQGGFWDLLGSMAALQFWYDINNMSQTVDVLK